MPSLSLICNFSVPSSSSTYLHRSGRCARDPFHRVQGAVVTLVREGEEFALRRIANELNIEINLMEAN